MIFILGKVMQMVALELGEYYNKEPREIDADTIVPYLVFVIIKGVSEVNEGITEFSQAHLMNTAYKVRLLMVEFFTIQEMNFGEGYYAFASFKNVEKMIEDT